MFSDTIDLKGCTKDGFVLIKNHGLIASNRTAALVGVNGDIDWACLPKFDSDPLLAGILDYEKGGHFIIAPNDTTDLRVYQNYREMTNILVTEFIKGSKTIMRLTDFIPVSEFTTINFPEIHRYVEAPESDIQVSVTFNPIFDFGNSRPSIEKSLSGFVFSGGNYSVALACDVPLTTTPTGVQGVFTLKKHSSRWFVILSGVKHTLRITDYRSYERLEETTNYWKNWISQCTYHGIYSQHVLRSALALKGLFYEPSGLMVAAPTTSLPECVGGERNWDYRYAWIRDTAYVVEALSMIGLKKEATKFLYDMMENISKDNDRLKTIYTIDGSSSLNERTVDFEGYLHSRPVRIGNKASRQLQIDEYGSIINSIYYLSRIGGTVNSYMWNFVIDFLKRLESLWKEPDSSIWEFRTERKHYVYSKLLCWAAFDRAIQMGKILKMSAPYEAWKAIAAQIKQAILDNGTDSTHSYLTQSFGSDQIDAALLRAPLLGILPASDPLITGTVAKIEKDLMHDGYLFRRYLNDDGLKGNDNAFLMLSFWYVEDLIEMGKLKKAREVFESLLQRSNHLNLFSEEIEFNTGDLIGNFPQALSHIGVIRCASKLTDSFKQNLRTSESRYNY